MSELIFFFLELWCDAEAVKLHLLSERQNIFVNHEVKSAAVLSLLPVPRSLPPIFCVHLP